jgi:hypothetical protein
MVIEFGGLQIDLTGVREAFAGGGKESPSTYTVDISSHDPPPGYAVGRSRDGGIEIAVPRLPLREALIAGVLYLLALAWPVGWLHEGHPIVAVLGALFIAYNLVKVGANFLVQTSWVVADHWFLRRRVLWGLPAWEDEFAVDFLEVDNAQWRTGRGSTDTLWLQSPPPGSQRVKVREDGLLNLLQFGKFLAHRANVPLDVVVRKISEPD